MYLSLLTIRRSSQGFTWLSNPYNIHQTIMRACEHAGERVLFRVMTDGVLVQSRYKPDWTAVDPTLFASIEVKEYSLEGVKRGDMLRFKLVANPVQGPSEKRKPIFDESELLDWLRRKLKDVGAILLDGTVAESGKQVSVKQDGTEMVHHRVYFYGKLGVVDAQAFTQAVENGIGPAKGMGFGMLTLARPQ